MYYAFFHYQIFGGYLGDRDEQEDQELESIIEEGVGFVYGYEDLLCCDFSVKALHGVKVNIMELLLHELGRKGR